jgi:hypothetical protein
MGGLDRIDEIVASRVGEYRSKAEPPEPVAGLPPVV